MRFNNTRLRFVSSKDPLKLVGYSNKLPYRIEIKGNPVWNGKKYVLFFILPDDLPELAELKFGDLD